MDYLQFYPYLGVFRAFAGAIPARAKRHSSTVAEDGAKECRHCVGDKINIQIKYFSLAWVFNTSFFYL